MNMKALELLFGFDPSRHSLRKEIMGGLTTFFAMAYIMAANPSIFAALPDMPNGAVFTATALAAILGTLVMSVYAKKPFALAPGMGLNAFFVFSVCIGMGYSWQFAITAILIEGIIFLLMSVTHLRELVVYAIPQSMQKAIGAGIGLFMALIGLHNMGLVVGNESTLLALGDMSSPSVLLGFIGIVIVALLVVRNVIGGIMLGILITAVIGIPMGVTNIGGVVSMPESVSPLLCQFTWDGVFSWDMFVVVVTFLFFDFFDTLGSVVGLSIKTGMVDENGKIDRLDKILVSDAIATTVGACCGASTTTTFVESAAGVAVGGRTGLTSFVVAVCFALSLFLSPLFLSIPPSATGASLVIVGAMMVSPIKTIDWDDYSEAIPVFLTMIMMPFTYNIGYGIMMGVICYVLTKACTGKFRDVSITMWVISLLFLLKHIFM